MIGRVNHRCLTLAIAGWLVAAGAAAQTVRYDFDSDAALIADGFAPWSFEGSSMTFSGGQMHITTAMGYSEWLLRPEAPSNGPTDRGWLKPGAAARGYRMEVRMQLARREGCPTSDGTGLWIGDGVSRYRLIVHGDSVRLEGLPSGEVAVSTDAFHVYRIESPRARQLRLFIDGAMVLEGELPSTQSGSREIEFGDLGGCTATDSSWDYLSYELFGADSPPGDQDGDGVEDAEDLCALLADPDQADGDEDGVGDGCDVCPNDAENDSDFDGVCGDEDPCPGDQRNDDDGDGVCDRMQCTAFESAPQIPGAPTCPAVCTCPFWGIDPINGLDNFGPPGGAGSNAAGTGGIGNAMAGAGAQAGTGGSSGSTGMQQAAGLPTNGVAASGAETGSSGGGCALAPPRPRASLSQLALLGSTLALLRWRRRPRHGSPSTRPLA